MPTFRNDPHWAEAQAAQQAFQDGIMPMEEALQRIWSAMGKAAKDKLPTARYVALSDAVNDEQAPDKDLEAEVAKSWKS